MSKVRTLVLLAAGLVAMPGARAELTIEITEGVSDPIPIAIVPFGWSAIGTAPFDVAELVATDLKRSGRFRPMDRTDMIELPTRSEDVEVDDWKLLRNDFVVVGQLQPGAEGRYTIQYELVNVLNGQKLLLKQQTATTATLRAASHRVADVIFEKLTGIRGAFYTRIAYVTASGVGGNIQYALMIADSDGYNPQTVVRSR